MLFTTSLFTLFSAAAHGLMIPRHGGVMDFTDSVCGYNSPTSETTEGGGPNGKESWLNCHLTSSGWHPPNVHISNLAYVSLESALDMSDNVFGPCSRYLSTFNQVADETGIPSIMLASFAMQESTCNADAYSSGTTGLFQLSSANCRGIDCYDAYSNTKAAAKFISSTLDSYGGNVIQMVGEYDGWWPGMKKSDVWGPCGSEQNLDYLQQFFNTWMQGQEGYDTGTIQNCGYKRSENATATATPSSIPGWHF